MDKKILYLKTLLCCSACDGEIAPEEVDLIRSLIAKNEIFDGIEAESAINDLISELNDDGLKFIKEYLDAIRKSELDKKEQLLIIRLAIDMIEADNKIVYSEVKFFKRIRNNLTISDEDILEAYPINDDYLLPDNMEPIDIMDWNYTFDKIILKNV
ncbi:MAG: TerB family tellurite resistance protein [Lachnospiraceae bacterium]|uniref:tellurite resistance TerB family protein n=1 Tax=uncultured Muribaculum sp. TaxID=1918613 RepID=UPI002597BB87|nr:TerB family tellurite resistance protein [uncultured Muribaculum sp.]MCM1094536.1 TerB family tellurite resistance protein [Lachnospiraceae bacterium]